MNPQPRFTELNEQQTSHLLTGLLTQIGTLSGIPTTAAQARQTKYGSYLQINKGELPYPGYVLIEKDVQTGAEYGAFGFPDVEPALTLSEMAARLEGISKTLSFMKNKPCQIVIEIEEGIVNGVFANRPTEYVILDTTPWEAIGENELSITNGTNEATVFTPGFSLRDIYNDQSNILNNEEIQNHQWY